MRDMYLGTYVHSMKKFKLNVKRGSEPKNVWLFTDPESLVIWLMDFNASMSELEELTQDTTRVLIRPEDKVEVEWMGCEYVYSYDEPIRLDLVRLVKASPPLVPKSSKKGLFVSGYSGWIVSELLTLRHNHRRDDVIVRRITESQSEVLMPADDHMVHAEMLEGISKIMKSLNLPKV